MSKVIEIDAITGIVIERERTQEESEQSSKDVLEKQTMDANAQAEAETKAAVQVSAMEKLSALGLTTEEIAALTK